MESKLIQVIPLPPNKMVVDEDGDECECDIVAYFYSDYDGCFHEAPMVFGELNEIQIDVRDAVAWGKYFEMVKGYEIVDRE